MIGQFDKSDKQKALERICGEHTYDRANDYTENIQLYRNIRRIPYQCQHSSLTAEGLCEGQLVQDVEYHKCTACGKDKPEEVIIRVFCISCKIEFKESPYLFTRFEKAEFIPDLVRKISISRRVKK